MNDSRLVATSLLRIYRSAALWFWSITICGVAIAVTLIETFGELKVSLWLLVSGSTAKWGLSLVGLLLVSTHLKQFVATGVTRRAFLAGSAMFGLAAVVLFSLIVTIGHGVEQSLLSLNGTLPAGYPSVATGSAVTEFLHVLQDEVAYLVAGAAITAGFYRFGPWPGLLLIVPGVLPVLVAETLLGRGLHGEPVTRFLPFGLALTLFLLATVFAAGMLHRELRDAAIRPPIAQ
jgi:hypothetical protein